LKYYVIKSVEVCFHVIKLLLEDKLTVSIYYQISFVFNGILNFCYRMFFKLN